MRHNFDVIHIEKNLTDNLLNTLLDSKGAKDNLKSRLDLQEMGLRSSLHAKWVGSERVVYINCLLYIVFR